MVCITGDAWFSYAAMERETLARYKAWGAHGEFVRRPGDFRPALERARQVAVEGSCASVINCQGMREFWLRDTHPPGMLGKIEPGCMSHY